MKYSRRPDRQLELAHVRRSIFSRRCDMPRRRGILRAAERRKLLGSG